MSDGEAVFVDVGGVDEEIEAGVAQEGLAARGGAGEDEAW
jgi:hypothetical protein